MKARLVYIALGSNLGDRHAHLAHARRRIPAAVAGSIVAESRVEETAPLGGAAQPEYLNQMIAVTTALDVEPLLERLHDIEREAGRVRRDRWDSRTLDLDLVMVEGEERQDAHLTLPHPGLASRDFWQRELAELRAAIGVDDREVMSAPAPAPSPEAAADVALPAWSVASPRRRDHIRRVTALLGHWADALQLDHAERTAWYDAGRWHDALRDADEASLRALVPDVEHPLPLLHGPAAARRLEMDGERRRDVLEAVHYHTVGSAGWGRTGRALYMADFLDPGRPFAREDRAFLAGLVPHDFDGVFRQVVRQRIEWALREGKELHAEGVALWNVVR